jgi:hypothetical protein
MVVFPHCGKRPVCPSANESGREEGMILNQNVKSVLLIVSAFLKICGIKT